MKKTLSFTKMHGIGNDYIYFYQMNDFPLPPNEMARFLSNRHFSIGSDGIIIIDKSDQADAKMRMFNADGSEAEMCGNGLRCVAKYLFDRGLVTSSFMTIETAGNIVPASIIECGDRVSQVEITLPEPDFSPELIPLNADHPYIDESLEINGEDGSKLHGTVLTLGNPHCVIFIQDNLFNYQVRQLGPVIENNVLFPQKTNVEFVNVRSSQHLDVRVWERGSGETLACGSGACASVVAGILTNRTSSPCTVSLPGGDLIINWKQGQGILLRGPAEEVFTGEIPLAFFKTRR